MGTQTITTRVRMILQDVGRPFAANVTLDGVSNVFDLPVESISATATPPTVLLNGNLISDQATPPYVFDYKHGVISFYSPPQPAGGTLGVSGITYAYYDDDEVAQAVSDAFYQHTDAGDMDPLPVIDPLPGQPSITSGEEYLVALLAVRELLWMQATDISQQINVDTPQGVRIEVSERYQQLIAQINAITVEYQQLAGAMGVGLFRIQVTNQRRVSLTTNRLVPLYREQEYNAPYCGFNPTAAPVGAVVTIYGMYFTAGDNVTPAVTQVSFGGVPAQTFTVLNDTELEATVPTGAQTGQIAVTTTGGVVLSTAQFVVGQPAPVIMYGPDQVTPPIPTGQ